MKKHEIKRERPEPSASYSRGHDEHDLAYYIHDRVELMHQVFSALKPKDLKAMTPACIRHLSVDNIKELCTEELLGISSKRLCAILDGAEPPSDTESSMSASPERLETISLDSISSDEEILSQASKKKKKHRHREKSKRKKKKHSDEESNAGEKSKASRAGLTVLELLELQARARAIRAQLQQEQVAKQKSDAAVESSPDDDDDEVLVKEEPPEVVEISSDDEKPAAAELKPVKQNAPAETENTDGSQKLTKRINNLVITVPQSKPSRKIKLNRTKPSPAAAPDKPTSNVENDKTVVSLEHNKTPEKTNNVETTANKPAAKDAKVKEKFKKKQKKKEKKKDNDRYGSDHDEITLQLSDSEKLDLLEDLDRKNFDRISSQSSEDSESSSNSSSESNTDDDKGRRNSEDIKQEDVTMNELSIVIDNQNSPKVNISTVANETDVDVNKEATENTSEMNPVDIDVHKEDVTNKKLDEEQSQVDANAEEKTISVEKIEEEAKEVTGIVTNLDETEVAIETSKVVDESASVSEIIQDKNEPEQNSGINKVQVSNVANDEKETEKASSSKPITKTACENNIVNKNASEKQMSDGELSDRDSSEVEATEIQSEVVCISDEESSSKKSKKKHKKKEKKNKKEKKAKKNKSDFCSGSDQNFYKDNENCDNETNVSIFVNKDNYASETIVIDEDDIYEILELSDDSSCYEVEGTVLSKEPTTEEIEALSAKIDEIERVDVVTEEEIREHEQSLVEQTEIVDDGNLEKISWKDRYLGSSKVKRILTTSNILNALRKKNKELKNKLEESKTKEPVEQGAVEVEVETPQEQESNLEEGSMEQYNTLQGSTKYVNPVKEPEVISKETQNTEENDKKTGENKNKDGVVTKEMKKDAKQLLKMYKRLLKYNDMNKQKDPNKKKKKKQKKKSKDSENAVSVVNNGE